MWRREKSIGRMRAAQWRTLGKLYDADAARTRKSGLLSSSIAVEALRAECADAGKPTRNGKYF